MKLFDTQKPVRQLSAIALAGLLGATALTACSTEEAAPEDTANAPAAEETVDSSVNDDQATQDDQQDDRDDQDVATDDDQQAGGAADHDDPAFGIIDTVLAQYSGGVITDIDRDDNGSTYEVEVVVGNDLYELDVTANGDITETDRDRDEDDVRKAQNATVTAEEAIADALSRHEGGVLDSAELDEDDGRLVWEIDLDDANGNDLAELDLPADN